MNAKPLLYLSCLLAMTLPASITWAGPHRSGNNHFVSTQRSGPGRTFVGNHVGTWNGQHWNTQRWSNQRFTSSHWNNNWNWHHHHHHGDFVFFDVGFPFWGFPYYDYYPYDYYPYGYSPYGYYGSSYYGSGYDYGNGYGYNNSYNSYGYTNGSNVVELQRKLAAAGYYHGAIDGIMGSRTYYALRAYRHDHGNGNGDNRRDYPTQRSRPYYPPSNTTEPSPGD